MLHKMLRCLVQQRPTRNFRAPGDFHQSGIEQLLHHAVHRYTANRLNIGFCDRLAIGNDRQGFEGRGAEPGRPHLRKQLAHPDLVFRPADQHPARNLLNQAGTSGSVPSIRSVRGAASRRSRPRSALRQSSFLPFFERFSGRPQGAAISFSASGFCDAKSRASTTAFKVTMVRVSKLAQISLDRKSDNFFSSQIVTRRISISANGPS